VAVCVRTPPLVGVEGAPGSYVTVVIREKRSKGGWSEKVRMFKLC
jgi:hypothetical protein